MSKPEWTEQQKNAIEAKGGTLLVSAAAGSGKTAVLVERLKRKIADKDNPCSVNNILVVTFTNAAAANMKTKIAKSISEAIKEDPGNAWLRSQLNLLPFAKISTIDKFCIDLVRDNFHSLDISPDFRLIDSSREAVLQNEAMNIVLDNYAVSSPEGYDRMSELICGVRDDSEISAAIKSIYKKSPTSRLKRRFGEKRPIITLRKRSGSALSIRRRLSRFARKICNTAANRLKP